MWLASLVEAPVGQDETMIPGSLRYSRQLGFVGVTTAESQRNDFERWTGLDFTGTLKPSGGTGITVGMTPSTFIAMALGAAIGFNNSTSKAKGLFLGAGSAVVFMAIAKGAGYLGV